MNRKNNAAHSNHERWLVARADFITLAFALFVVLYSWLQVDPRRAGQAATAIQAAVRQINAFEAENAKTTITNAERMAWPKVRMAAPGGPDFQEIRAALEKTLAGQIQRHTVTITETKEGFLISLCQAGPAYAGACGDEGAATMHQASRP